MSKGCCYTFNDGDFVFNVQHDEAVSSRVESAFDKALKAKWMEHMDAGHFTYKLEKVVSRVMPGKYGYIAQYTPERGDKRRMPQVRTLVES